MAKCEDLFGAEQALREAAFIYARWMESGDASKQAGRDNLNAARKRLRAAALAYASQVNDIEKTGVQ